MTELGIVEVVGQLISRGGGQVSGVMGAGRVAAAMCGSGGGCALTSVERSSWARLGETTTPTLSEKYESKCEARIIN